MRVLPMILWLDWVGAMTLSGQKFHYCILYLQAKMLGASSTSDLISCSVVRCSRICKVDFVNVSVLFV